MAGRERGQEWGQCGRVWSGLSTILGETRGTIAFVIGGVCVVVCKVKVRWHFTCGLCSKAKEGYY